jgi:hypothetical protein
VSVAGLSYNEVDLDSLLHMIEFLCYHTRSPIAMYRGGHREWDGAKHLVDCASILSYILLMTRINVLCSEFSEPELPH